jgi:glycogen synthase
LFLNEGIAADAAHAGSGFVFGADTAEALAEAIGRAVAAWRNPARWKAIQQAGMRRDFGWQASAEQYVEAYRRALAHVRSQREADATAATDAAAPSAGPA